MFYWLLLCKGANSFFVVIRIKQTATIQIHDTTLKLVCVGQYINNSDCIQ